MDTRKAQLGREWQALTDEHERQLESAKESFDAFQNGETVDPLALVGAYRSGKTQLIYHLFEKAWDRGIPAFYIGDPGAMLVEFQESSTSQLEEWIQERINEQLEAYAAGDADEIDWFPNVDTATKQEYVESKADFEATEAVTKTALFFDEVEQSYEDFLSAMDKDDDNPLRKINDNLQDTIKVWSFGMISAFEFIGEADWGRMKEIRIPPLTVADVRHEVLEERRSDAVDLANTIWWLARGRTGLIIKLVDELPADVEEGAIDWLKERAEADFKDTRLINNLWTELEHSEWNPAIEALLFRADGLDNWQIDDEKALNCGDCQTVAVNIAKDEYDFPDTETGNDAQALLARNIERVFQGLAIGEEELFPRLGLMKDEQADAFLDLVGNMTVSFEPASPERRLAVEALDHLEGVFSTQWTKRVSDKELVDREIVTAKPDRIRDAFPPIAVNPERVADRGSDDLREEMERGLALQTGDSESEFVTIRFCPTESTASAELEELTRSYDITSPTILVVPEDEGFDLKLDETAQTYQRQTLLRVEQHQSNRFWSFVVNLYGRLEADEVDDPYFIDPALKKELVERIDEREVRNTIETLYEQLDRVALDQTQAFAKEYRDTFSIPNTNTLLWEEERLTGSSPYWSNGRFDESTIALSYLPVFGPEYESNRKYTRLHRRLKTAIRNDLVKGGAGGFGYTEYFDNMFTQNGYGQKVKTERAHYRSDGQIAPAVSQTEATLTAFAELNDLSDITSRLDDADSEAEHGDIPVIGVEGLNDLAYPFLRAVLICGLTTGSEPEIEVDTRLETTVDRLKKKKDVIDTYIEDVESLNSELKSPESAVVGSWVDIEADRLREYQTNLGAIIKGTEDLIEKCRTDSSAAPLGYHYWFLLEEYLEDIGDRIDDFQSDINAANVNKISDARNLFDSIQEQIQKSEAVPLHFSSRESLLAQVEEFGDTIFDLEGHLGATSLSLPEDHEDLEGLNSQVEQHISELTELNDDLTTIEEESDALETEFEKTKNEVRQLLTEEKEVTVNE